MNIIITGLGEAGLHLTRKLYAEGHNISGVDSDEERTRRVAAEADVRIVRGHAASPKILQQAGAAEADLLLAVTNLDETNLVACFNGKHLGAKKAVAVIRRTDRLLLRRNVYRDAMGVDLLVTPATLVVTEVLRIIRDPVALAVENFARGRVTIRRFKVPEGPPWLGKPLQEVAALRQSLVAMVTRNGKCFIPTGSDHIRAGDQIFVISTPGRMGELEKVMGFKTDASKRVAIVGGGTIGVGLALGLEALGMDVRLIELQRSKCESVLERVKKTEVIHGDGLDPDLLKEERIGTMDVVITCTSRDEISLMSALLAKQFGVARVMTVMRSVETAALGERLGIDSAFTPAMLTADRIFQYILKGHVTHITTLAEGEAEVFEAQIAAQSPVADKRLSDIRFPKGSLVGAVIRGDDMIVPTGAERLLPGDTVVLFALAEVARKVESLLHG
ncbi:MAG: Trk system potassium transporter TrkA [Nitrospirae bacterium]|nr:Trk system potassium transporter TrkA [Nitrospirota bacterium]